MLPRHDTGVEPSIVAGREKFSIPRLRSSTDADSVSGTPQYEIASWMGIFEIDNAELNGDCTKLECFSVLSHM